MEIILLIILAQFGVGIVIPALGIAAGTLEVTAFLAGLFLITRGD